MGTIVNELFHHFYYHIVYKNQEIRLRTPLRLQLSLYIIVAAMAAGLLWVVLKTTGLSFVPAVAVSLVILAILNTIINRISTFSSSELAMVEYQEMGESLLRRSDPMRKK